jgi:stage IV sporulation protein FB
MMTDPLTWSPIHLGRWGGTQIRIHVFLIVFVVFRFLNAAIDQEHAFLSTAVWLGLLLLALAAHELGHALVAAWLEYEHDEIRLWPLGDMSTVSPSTTSRPVDTMLIAIAGPLVNLFIVIVTAIVLFQGLGAVPVWHPFGNDGTGVPLLKLTGKPVDTFSPAWYVGWFGYLNYVILLANLIPAPPFDGGRFFRAYVSHASLAPIKESPLPYLATRVCVILLFVVGLLRLILQSTSDGLTLIFLAILIELMVRAEARMMEDGGFFDDGVFGYDFSEGYTSLEGSTAKVRPYRESALKRWRRRRSDLRRQRRQVREAAEEQRMDEILEKLHRHGRSALSDEEYRFLVRVSAKYRNRPRAGE